MAKTVRKLKRRSKDTKYTPTRDTRQNEMEFSVNELIAKLSENSKSSKNEMESIQKKLLQQANQILFGPKLMDKNLNTDKVGKMLNIGPKSGKFDNLRMNGNRISDPVYMEPTQDRNNGQVNGIRGNSVVGSRLSDPTLNINPRFSNGRLENRLEPTRDTSMGRTNDVARTVEQTHDAGTRQAEPTHNNSRAMEPSHNVARAMEPTHDTHVEPTHDNNSRINSPRADNSRENVAHRAIEIERRAIDNIGRENLTHRGIEPVQRPRAEHNKANFACNSKENFAHTAIETKRQAIDRENFTHRTVETVESPTRLGPKVESPTRLGPTVESPTRLGPRVVNATQKYALAAAFGTGSGGSAASSRAAFTGTVSSVPPYRMPPAPEAALPGAPAPPAHAALNHVNFPIEREVILSCGDVAKVPALQDRRRRPAAVAPDTPPKPHAAWHAENQQAGSSCEFRQYHDQYGYAVNQNQNTGAVARNVNYDPKPPIPAKNTPNNSHITVTVETGKDSTRDAPKSNKSVSKTYHTLKDMISSRFKKDNNDEKNNEEPRLNNTEERKRPEIEHVTPRETPRKVEQGIYGRPMPQNRPDMQYNPAMASNMAYHSPSPHRQMMQQHLVQQQMMMSQARSQEMLASPHRQQAQQALGADALYQQYGPPGRRSAVYQRDLDVRSMANFTSLKTGPQAQYDNSHSRADLRSPQQLEREIVRQRGFIEGRRASSHPHLLDEPQQRPEVSSPHTPQINNRSRRSSQGNLLEGVPIENSTPRQNDERESDDGGFRMRLAAQRSSVEERIRSSGRSIDSRQERSQDYRRTPDSHRERRTPDSHRERRTPDSLNQRGKDDENLDRTDENVSQKSVDSVYNASVKERHTPQPASSRQTPNRIEDLKAHGKKASGSAASSDYDKNGGQSSNVDSGRGSVAYSSGRRPDASLHDTSADSDAVTTRQPQPSTSQQNPAPVENEWADLVECELRQILEPKLSSMRLDSSDSSDSDVTPPLPPLSPSSDLHKRNSLPGRSAEYPEERRRGRESPRWHAHKKHSSKRDHHYKKHLFGLDTTDMTSTTTRSLDLSSLLDARSDARSDSDASGDARAIRRQLRGLENMYAEVLQLLGVRKPARPTPWEASRLSSKRRYGSMSSLPSSSVSSRPTRDKRRSSHDSRKKHDLKGINKRFARLEAHVVTLARSVAHLSSEMRTQHLVMAEMDNIRAEIAALRHMYKSQQFIRSGHRHTDPFSFSNPDRVKRLTKFFGDEPPLMRLFLKKLGYEKYAALLEKEKVGAAELPYVGEDRLRALGVPLGPRMRILREAGVHDLHMQRDDMNTTTTTLAIV